jgi:hypothetical protein
MQIRSDSWIPDPCVRLFAQISATIVLISMQYQRYFLFLVWNLAANTSRSTHILNTLKIKKPKSVKTWASKYLYNNILSCRRSAGSFLAPAGLRYDPIQHRTTFHSSMTDNKKASGPRSEGFFMPPIVHAFLALRAAIRMV